VSDLGDLRMARGRETRNNLQIMADTLLESSNCIHSITLSNHGS